MSSVDNTPTVYSAALYDIEIPVDDISVIELITKNVLYSWVGYTENDKIVYEKLTIEGESIDEVEEAIRLIQLLVQLRINEVQDHAKTVLARLKNMTLANYETSFSKKPSAWFASHEYVLFARSEEHTHDL